MEITRLDIFGYLVVAFITLVGIPVMLYGDGEDEESGAVKPKIEGGKDED